MDAKEAWLISTGDLNRRRLRLDRPDAVLYGRALGYLECLQEGPEVKALVKSLEDFRDKIILFNKRQRELLVDGQNLDTASKNWEDFPEAFSFDFNPLLEALVVYKEEIK